MKIILTTHQFFPDFSSGTEVLTLAVARELQRKGHEVLVFTGYPGKNHATDESRFDRYQYNEIPVIRFSHDLAPMGDQVDLMEIEYDNHLVAQYFRKLLETEQPDIIHFFHLSRISSSPIPECMAAGLPIFFTPTDFWGVCPLNQLLMTDGTLCSGPDKYAVNCIRHLTNFRKGTVARASRYLPNSLIKIAVKAINAWPKGIHPLLKMVHSAAIRPQIVLPRLNSLNAIFAPNRFMADMLVKNGIAENLIRLSPYGMDLNFPITTRQTDQNNRLRIGFIGTLSRYKGSDLLIRAVLAVPKMLAEVKIFGDLSAYPDYAKELHCLAANDNRIRFMGTFDNAVISQIFSEIDVLVVPSIWYENTPLVIYSAQACGCPVIASDIGGISEVVKDGENGLLFAAGQVKEITSALLRLSEDRSLLAKLANKTKKPRSISDYVSELLSEYELALNK